MLLISVVGVVAGTINTLVGGGTLMVLPLLIFVGIDPLVANGTNRVCVAIQAAVAGWTMSREQRRRDQAVPGDSPSGIETVGWWPFALVLFSSIPGAWCAIQIDTLDSDLFQRVMGVVLLVAVLAFLTLKTPKSETARPSGIGTTGFFIGCILCGLYGGFMGAGIGAFVILLLTTAFRMPLVEAVRCKVWMVMVLSAAAGAWYLADGFFHLETALFLIPSYALGGVIGGRIVLRGEDRILRPIVAILSAALALTILSGWP
ncbi:MAG: sulfite exporter TauE/SafE family protein [Planctomycetota bacterium]|nr:sulfite exporter TauE/SafE family protein [Planctomycetota bacterium]